MNVLETLSRNEMKNIKGGDYPCQIYSNGSWSGYAWSVEDAQSWYNNHPEVTGYCCASCGGPQFPNA